MKRLMIIVNPIAGKLRIKQRIFDVIDIFTKAGYETVLFPTMYRGNATELVQKNADNFDLVVCCGGDGTLKEVTAGLNGKSGPPIGYIPAGSTNDMANALRLPHGITRAAEFIVNNEPRFFDMGNFNEKSCFNYIACFGAFSEVSWATDQTAKNMFGHLAYVLESPKYIQSIKPQHIKIEFDSHTLEDDFIFGAVSNSTSVGGIVKLDRDLVDFNDGLFEIMLIRNPDNALAFQQIANDLLTRKYTSEYVSFFQTGEVSLTTFNGMNWSLDGELEEAPSNVSIKNIHSAIKLIY